MDKKEFEKKVSHPAAFTSQERGWLKAKLAKYPYSSVLSALALMADRAYGYDTAEERRAVWLSVCGPEAVEGMVSSARQAEALPAEAAAPKPVAPAAPAAPAAHAAPVAAPAKAVEPVAATPKEAEPATDILNEINTFQEVSFKTAPKSVILSKFLQTEPEEEVVAPPERAPLVDFNDKKSLTPDIALGTETLAVILEQQGKYDRALAIYKNLLARNPEKSSIFAPRIKKLKALLK